MFHTVMQMLASPEVIGALVFGVALGMAFGVLPGLGATSGTAILISATYAMSTPVSLALLLGLYMAATYSGSITAISIGIPGTPAAAASMIDGYAMNKAGKMQRALSISIAAATFGGLAGTIVLILFTIPLGKLIIGFSAPEYFALGVLGVSMVASLSRGMLLGGFIMMLFGLLLTTVGLDPIYGFPRFTFGNVNLLNGIPYVSAMIGLFAISEVIILIAEKQKTEPASEHPRLGFIAFDMPFHVMRKVFRVTSFSSAIGILLGAMPMVGAAAANWVGYNESKKIAHEPHLYGTGSEEGLAASESAANATVSSSFIPLLTFGIPGSATDAIILGALLLHGVTPGPDLFRHHLPLLYFIFAILMASIVLMLLFGVVGVGMWIRLVRMPKAFIITTIGVLSLVGAFSIRSNITDVYLTIVFGLLGYLIRRARLSVVPIVLAMVLGTIIETNFRRSLIMSDAGIGIFMHRPVALAVLVIAIASFLYPIVEFTYHKLRGAHFSEQVS